jgi:hypothetical protein
MEDEEAPLINTDFADLYPHVMKSMGTERWPMVLDATYYMNMVEGLLAVDYTAREITMVARHGKLEAEILIASHDRTVVRAALQYLGTEFSGEEPEDPLEVTFLRTLLEKLKMKARSEKFGL